MNAARKLGPHTQTDRGTCPGFRYTTGPGGKQNWYYWLEVTELARCVGAAARRKLRGGNSVVATARRDLRCAIYAARSCAARNYAARLNSDLGLNSNRVRGAVAVNRH